MSDAVIAQELRDLLREHAEHMRLVMAQFQGPRDRHEPPAVVVVAAPPTQGLDRKKLMRAAA